ncbi:MAG: glycosyl hydrolase [Acidobacteriia bacterium]|nr:glycosyl hydrolase [Terriglobia bacterium]
MRCLPLLLASCSALAQTWISHPSGVTAALRGVSATSPKVVWASGSSGTYLKTTDGGATWRTAVVPGAGQLDFRDVHALDAQAAFLLSSGPGDQSRVYKTADAGRHWTLQLTNPDASGFFDVFAFWDARNGILLGDPVGGEFVILTTADGGAHWQKQHTPPALPKEGAFAASGTCLIAAGKTEAWFATGGPGGARVFHSKDRGRTWTVAATPIRNDAPTAGIFSLAFRDPRHGIAIGGDYAKPGDASHNLALTSDGGRTWRAPRASAPAGYRSAVVFVPQSTSWIAVGPSGSDLSRDDGDSWTPLDTASYNALSLAPNGVVWAVGSQGRIASLR